MSETEAIVKYRAPSLSSLEADVIRLREGCRRVLEELERRYDRVVHLPRRIKQATWRAPSAVLRAVRRHPFVALASVAAVVGAVVLLQRRR